jgi:F-type H+-transporting ATPase subunit epsilon
VAKEKFTAEVLTPEGSVFKDEVEMVSTRTTVGSIGILAKHQPLLGMLEPTELRLYKSESDIVRLAQGEGYVQVSREGVLLLVQDAEDPSSLNVSDLQDRLRRAEEECEKAEEGTEELRAAERAKRRYEAFLKISEGA